jgi:hypothetical protein
MKCMNIPCGTETSFPSTVSVISACREDVDEIDLRSILHVNTKHGFDSVTEEYKLLCVEQDAPTTFPNVDVGRDAVETIRNIEEIGQKKIKKVSTVCWVKTGVLPSVWWVGS